MEPNERESGQEIKGDCKPGTPLLIDPSQLEPEEQLLELLALQRSLPLEECPVPVAFITGIAGTGKTTLVRKVIEKNPKWAVLSATTGIAAVNLDATTIHSLLGYSDTDSLKDKYASGYLASRLHKLAHEYENILTDEISMFDGRQLRLIHHAVEEVNQYESMTSKGRRLGIIVTGDFCQLPPINSPWVFEDREIWPAFERRTIRLTKVWRQENEEFLKALGLLRAGEGKEAAAILKNIVNWRMMKDHHFTGTTIVATNDEVERHNKVALDALEGEIIGLPAVGWGVLGKNTPLRTGGSQWKNIPEMLRIKIGAYVMILTNSSSFGYGTKLEYANGSFGFVRGVDGENKFIRVELSELGEPTGTMVNIPRITRYASRREEPTEGYWDPETGMSWDGKTPFWDEKRKRFHIGGLTYIPLRLGYASTVHKCQGLTLEKAQIDTRAHFFRKPGMSYVALSRCRTPEGVTIIGTPSWLATKVCIDEKVRKWL